MPVSPRTEGFAPVVRFAVCSDTHIREENDVRLSRLRLFADCAYRRLTAVDAFFFVGDLTDHGRPEQLEAFYGVWKAAVRPGSETFAVLAKNHDNWEFGREAVKTGLGHYRRIFGKPAAFQTTFGPYAFIGVSTSEETGVYYTEAQRLWLRTALENARSAHPGKRIFVFQHEHVGNTVFGSFPEDGWGGDWFTDILKDYPEAVHFSGHSHYPLNDPRSLYTGDFTAVGTGAMSYAELTADGERKIHPEGYEEIAQGWLVEADANNTIRLTGVDFLSDTVLCEYLLAGEPLPIPPAPILKAPPVLRKTAEKTILRLPEIDVPKNSPIIQYDIRLADAEGKATNVRHIPPYWRAGRETDRELEIPPDTKTAGVTAKDAFGRTVISKT